MTASPFETPPFGWLLRMRRYGYLTDFHVLNLPCEIPFHLIPEEARSAVSKGEVKGLPVMPMTVETAGGGVQLALMSNRLEGIVRKMANTLLRTGVRVCSRWRAIFPAASSPPKTNYWRRRKACRSMCCPGPDLMAKSMKQVHPNFRRGDAFLHNSPYHGCSHPADHTILVPVIDDDGVHRFTVQAEGPPG